MGRGRLPVAVLVVGVGVAIGVVVWLAGTFEETPETVRPESPASSHPPQVRSPGRSRARVEAPPDPWPEPPSVSTLDRVAPLPDRHAASSREGAGGSLAAAVKRLIAPDCSASDSFGLCRDVHWGWGLRGVKAVLAEAAAELEKTGDTRRGVLLVGLAQADFELRDRASAEEHLVQAILALQADWAWQRKGIPRLVYFAGGPNVVPWSQTESAAFRKSDALDRLFVLSGAAVDDGGTWLVWSGKGDRFFKWTLGLAADDTKPEPAMAASIWTHAVLSRHNWQKPPHGLPAAAAIFRTTDGSDWKPSEATTDDEWRRAFEERRKTSQDAEWQQRLTDVEARVRDVMTNYSDRKSFARSGLTAFAVWSLSDEFARRFTVEELSRRFPGEEFPRADALRKLAALLAEFPPAPVAAATDSK